MTSTNKFKSETDSYKIDICLSEIAEKNSSALESLYRLTSSSVYGFALSILKNTHDAEDVMHDCYVSIFNSASGYRSKGKPMAWILTVVRNLCIMKIRERQKTQDIPQEDWENYIDSREDISPEDKQIIAECMKSLSDDERQIIILHSVVGFRHRETADMMNMPPATVLSKYNRGIKKLKKYYERSNGDE